VTSSRILPESCYDFWAEDSRDGEKGSVRGTEAQARLDVSIWRNRLQEWQRCCISLRRRVNERKVLALLRAQGKVG
jgi:hypothetical protein